MRTRAALVERRRSGARGRHRCRQRGEGRRGPRGGAAGAAGLRAGRRGAAGRGAPAGRTDGRDRGGGRRDGQLALLCASGLHRGGGRRRHSRRWRDVGGSLSPGSHAGEPESPPPPPPSPPPHPPRARARRRGAVARASHRSTAGQSRSSHSGAPTAPDSPIRSGLGGRPIPAPPSTPGPSRSASSPPPPKAAAQPPLPPPPPPPSPGETPATWRADAVARRLPAPPGADAPSSSTESAAPTGTRSGSGRRRQGGGKLVGAPYWRRADGALAPKKRVVSLGLTRPVATGARGAAGDEQSGYRRRRRCPVVCSFRFPLRLWRNCGAAPGCFRRRHPTVTRRRLGRRHRRRQLWRRRAQTRRSPSFRCV